MPRRLDACGGARAAPAAARRMTYRIVPDNDWLLQASAVPKLYATARRREAALLQWLAQLAGKSPRLHSALAQWRRLAQRQKDTSD